MRSWPDPEWPRPFAQECQMSTEDDLDKLCDALGILRRPRGRPRTGFANALLYTDEVDELRRSGISISRAVAMVAKRRRKTVQHIYACRKKIADTDPYEYCFERDGTEDL
jgi:hypothetical protein